MAAAKTPTIPPTKFLVEIHFRWTIFRTQGMPARGPPSGATPDEITWIGAKMPIHAPTLKGLQIRAITYLAIFLRNTPQSQAKAATPDEISSKNAHDFRSLSSRNLSDSQLALRNC